MEYRYEIGRDPDTDEILVADRHHHEIILRGGRMALEKIGELVHLANVGAETLDTPVTRLTAGELVVMATKRQAEGTPSVTVSAAPAPSSAVPASPSDPAPAGPSRAD